MRKVTYRLEVLVRLAERGRDERARQLAEALRAAAGADRIATGASEKAERLREGLRDLIVEPERDARGAAARRSAGASAELVRRHLEAARTVERRALEEATRLRRDANAGRAVLVTAARDASVQGTMRDVVLTGARAAARRSADRREQETAMETWTAGRYDGD